MKNHIKIILALAMAVAFVSCHKENPPVNNTEKPVTAKIVKPVIRLDTDSEVIIYPEEANVYEEIGFTVESEAPIKSVTAKSHMVKSEVSFNKETNRGILKLSAEKNYRNREKVVIYAENEGGVQTLDVETVPAFITVQKEPVLIGSASGRQTIAVSSNVPFKAEVESDWITVQGAAKDNFVVTFQANPDKYDGRTATANISDSRTGTIKTNVILNQTTAEDPLLLLTERELLVRIYDKLEVTPTPKNQTYHPGEYNTKDDYLVNWNTDEPLEKWGGLGINGQGKVWYLHLQFIPFCCELPEEIGYLSDLKEIWIAGETVDGVKAWKGEIPESFKRLSNLVDFEIVDAGITGEIPSWLPQLPKLKIFVFGGCNLTGNLPLFLNDMPALETFRFCGNRLNGKIDESLTKTKWWNTPCMGPAPEDVGIPLGMIDLQRGQQEGYRLWL